MRLLVLLGLTMLTNPLISLPASGKGDVRVKVSEAATERTGHFLVLFHSDVDPSVSERLILDANLLKVERPDLLPQHYLVAGTLEQVLVLAGAEEVAYLFPASDDIVAGNSVQGCMGPADGAGPAQYVSSQGQGWDGDGRGRAVLTYSISNASAEIGQEQFRTLVERALTEWAKHAHITFSYTAKPGERNVNFSLASRSHGDGFAFDGRGRVLAHTFYPSDRTAEPLAGDIHLDEDEAWITRQDPDLYAVILHELGHALGLGHSDRAGAVMYPYYRRLTRLQTEDINALQRLYEARKEEEAVEQPEPTMPPVHPPSPAPAEPPSQPIEPASDDRAAPALAITNPLTPVFSTSGATFRVAGTARDGSGIAEVRWTTSNGQAGVASGTTNWKTDAIALVQGDNRITIVARDGAGNTAQRAVVITRR